MNSAVKSKKLVERFNRFVEFSKARDDDPKAFSKRLDQIAKNKPADDTDSQGKTRNKAESEGTPEELANAGSDAVAHATRRGGRRHQPPRFAKSKPITMLQAQRLSKLAPVIEDCAKRYNVPVELICGVILQESGGNSRAVSHAGARGLMQLMPGTARRFGVQDSFDPRQNIEGGTKYLRFLLDRFKGNIELALAGYNAGEGNVEKHGMKIPPFAETRAYVPSVLGYTQAMIDIFASQSVAKLPEYARKV